MVAFCGRRAALFVGCYSLARTVFTLGASQGTSPVPALGPGRAPSGRCALAFARAGALALFPPPAAAPSLMAPDWALGLCPLCASGFSASLCSLVLPRFARRNAQRPLGASATQNNKPPCIGGFNFLQNVKFFHLLSCERHSILS